MFITLLVLSVLLCWQLIYFLLISNQKRKESTYIVFFALTTTLFLWAFTNYLSTLNPSIQENILLIKIIFALVTISNYLFSLFAYIYPKLPYNKWNNIYKIWLPTFTILVVLFITAGYVVSADQTAINDGFPSFKQGLLLFVTHSIIVIGLGFFNLLRKLKLESTDLEKRRLQLLVLGAGIMWIIVPVTNFIFTIVFETEYFASFSTFYVLALNMILVFSIYKYGLFNLDSAFIKFANSKRSLQWIYLLFLLIVLFLSLSYKMLGVITLLIGLFAVSVMFHFAIISVVILKQATEFNDRLKAEVNRSTFELKGSNDRLIELNKTKNDFISITSHQLRTPLTAVKSYLSILNSNALGNLNKEQTEAVESSLYSVDKMVNTINELLDTARIANDSFELEKRPSDINDIVTTEINQIKYVAKSKQIKIKYDSDINDPNILIDREKIREVVGNFLDNAVQYSPNNSKITVSLKITKNVCSLHVQDQGIGVPKEAQKILFTKFMRASNAQQHRPDGTGLGLFVANKIIETHGGKTIFKSTENEGSLFGFTIPVNAS